MNVEAVARIRCLLRHDTLRVLAAVIVLALGCYVQGTAAPATAQPAVQAPPPKEAASPAVMAIPLPEIAERAEHVAVLLRSAEQVPADADVSLIEAQLADAIGWIRAHLASTLQALASSPSEGTVANLGDSWRLMRRRLAIWSNTLTGRASLLEERAKQLEAMRATWSATRADPRLASAPASVVERVDATVAAIAMARRSADNRLAHVLGLQDQVVKGLTLCDDAVARIAQAGDALAGPLLARDSLPIWSREARTQVSNVSGQRLRDSFGDSLELTGQFFDAQRARVPLQLALFVLVVALARRARRAARRRLDKEPSEAAAAQVFELPISCAFVVALLGTSWIYSDVPRLLINLAELLVLLPAVLVVGRLASRAVVPAVYALAAFFLIDRVRAASSVVPVLEQWIFLLEMMSGIVFLALASRWEHVKTDIADEAPWRRTLAAVLWSQLCLLIAAVVASALGYMRVARLLGGAVLTSNYVALILYAGMRVADGLVVYALRARPAARLFMVQQHRPMLHRRVTFALRWLSVGIWIYFTLDALGLMSALRSTTAVALDARYARGSVSVSLGDVVAFMFTVTIAFALSAFVRFVLQEDVYPRIGLPRGVPYATSVLVHYVIVLGGFLFAVAAMGVDLTRIAILAGAVGVGVGFGLQNAVANFAAGIILLLERRIHVGDSIQLGDLQGQVSEIGTRASTIRTADGAEVIVPNGSLTSERVTNWTLSDRLRRVDLDVRVAYAADPDLVLEILRNVGKANPKARPDPAPDVVCTGFADDALNFVLRVWTAHAEEAESVLSELAVAVHRAIAAANIEIPIPQREIHVRADGITAIGPNPGLQAVAADAPPHIGDASLKARSC